MYKLTVFFFLIYGAWAFIEIYETEHAQQQLAEEISEMTVIAKAQQFIDKMKDGVGGTTIAIHYPSGRKFIHRNRWVMICNGEISKENGHCNGNSMESLQAYKPENPTDFCYIKNYNIINDTLCLSTHPVKMSFENGTVQCDSMTEYFATYEIELDEYLKLCENISSNTTYIYYANDHDPDHVEIPNDNARIKCENNEIINGNLTDNKNSSNKTITRSPVITKLLKEYNSTINKTGICIFTEQDEKLLKLMKYLQL